MIDRFGLLPDQVKNLFEITRLKLQATPIGIRKIEAGAKGGRIIFTSDPKIDVGKIIRLIQKQPNIYKLDGQEKLRFSKALDNAKTRVAEVEQLLTNIVA
jgi:transcription-repair coupling factor (superfamily II helicase)